MEEFIKKRFGRWIVVEFSHKDKYNNCYYKCRCDCGTEKIIAKSNLKSGQSKSCGCLQKIKPFESLYKKFVRTNKSRKVPVNLTYEDFFSFTTTGKCHYCGCSVLWHKHNATAHSNYNLDRKDNTEGYTLENCLVCCGICNHMKSSTTYDEFIKKVRDITHNLST